MSSRVTVTVGSDVSLVLFLFRESLDLGLFCEFLVAIKFPMFILGNILEGLSFLGEMEVLLG